jgi:hypothetical protein
MTKLILHVGPGKCGSSSIQQFFATHDKPCFQKTGYKLLDPLLIRDLNCEKPSESLASTFVDQLKKDITDCDTLILSHEFLFQNPNSVKNICELAQKIVSGICIIGYSRRQSGFMISSYSQWLFRSPNRINEVTKALEELNIDPVLFTGLERQLIASIANDFHSARQLSEYSILDWYTAYDNLSKRVDELGVEIKCGILPGKSSDIPLIHDFCAKAELTLHQQTKDTVQKFVNLSFNQDIVEAMNIAVTFGLDVSGPHQDNNIIELLSRTMASMEPLTQHSPVFLSNLKSYIDTYYWEPNRKLCKKYDLNETYFLPSQRFTQSEIMDIILNEALQRTSNKTAVIDNYRLLSGRMVELCTKLVKEKHTCLNQEPLPPDPAPTKPKPWWRFWE